ncbi:hypothetical protein FRB90_004862 [Tulasnella sp. 427]|nr:hypothetical protein FRB90_004862 [Tulasnella sp. 427]
MHRPRCQYVFQAPMLMSDSNTLKPVLLAAAFLRPPVFNLSQCFRHQLRPYSFLEVRSARGNIHVYPRTSSGQRWENWKHLNSPLALVNTLRPGPVQARFITSSEPVSDPAHTTTFINLPGSEPGVDPKRDSDEYAHITADSRIDVIDYCRDKIATQHLDNSGIISLLTQNGRSRPSWAKVRWINIKGIDWSVIRTLSLTYALEDVLHSRDYRSKVDYYKDQLFVKGLALVLPQEGTSTSRDDDWQKVSTSELGEGLHHGHQYIAPRSSTELRMKVARRTNWARKLNVHERNIYMFLFRDGTLITIHDSQDSVYDQSLKDRLAEPTSLLRTGPDTSVLLQSVLDLMVDHAVQVVDAFHEQILHLERETLSRPSMGAVKLLHMLSADVTLHKRTLTPLKTLVYGLRHYDIDRCAALEASADGAPEPSIAKVVPFMSHQSKVYIADVHDHLEYVLSSLETYETISENLISYCFNALSYATNQTMRRLTLATIVFFPLTILTSYFGMNFEHMKSIENSELLFWKIAVPITLGMIVAFSWRDLARFGKSRINRFRFRIPPEIYPVG